MKKLISSFFISFSMYSKIPVPFVKWDKESMKYAMCFFPLIGVVIGGIIYALSVIFQKVHFHENFQTVAYVLIPIFVTGGIHMDGFLDTMDGISSYQSKERKLEILKDPHAGAFAIISAGVYFLLSFGIWSEVSQEMIPTIIGIYVVSRSFSGLSVVSFPCAKTSGLAAQFSDTAHKWIVRATMIAYLFAVTGYYIGIHSIPGFVAVLGAIILFVYYRLMADKNFGGITGDLAGFYLTVVELVMVFLVVVLGKVI